MKEDLVVSKENWYIWTVVVQKLLQTFVFRLSTEKASTYLFSTCKYFGKNIFSSCPGVLTTY